MPNQNPEHIARDKIDTMLTASGWKVQDNKKIDFSVSLGIAVKEYQTDVGPADYVLFVDRVAVGIIEAKKEEEGHRISTVEEQSGGYAKAKLKWISNRQPLPFIYESTGTITRFRDERDPKPRSREVFSFHRPQTLQKWFKESKTLRERLQDIPFLPIEGLRSCQINAINNLETSTKANRPKALIQMATGSGKTYTAITAIYRLLKFSDAKRILFLVDTKNLGEQAEQEFMAYSPNDEPNRKFNELYTVQRLNSSYISQDAQVVISTIQRLYSILKGEPLDDAAELDNPAEHRQAKEPLPVVYNQKIPIEFFDFIVIDECHRSIYNLWQQVLDYFDAYLFGLTATPDKRTFGFFEENIVSEYSHEDAVADGVNVGHDLYTIETEITKQGGEIKAKQQIEKRNRLTRKKRWTQEDEDINYSAKQLDKNVVNPSQIRNIIRTFKNKLPEIFPNRKETPKTLVFAKTDSHADDIIKIIRQEFDEGNEFCKKVTYKIEEDPKSILAQFRNDYYPRIAVTVDMIATGTDIKPLECLLFMRDVKSKNYFEQMKGRGTRTLNYDDLKKVTPSAQSAKTHFVIVDAIGVSKSLKTDSRPLERNPGLSLKDLLNAVMMGVKDDDTISSLANRLIRLNKQLTPKEHEKITQRANGKTIEEISKTLLHAISPDVIEQKAKEMFKEVPYEGFSDVQLDEAKEVLTKEATNVFNGELNTLIESIKRDHDQIIDTINIDTVTFAGWGTDAKAKAQNMIEEFSIYLKENQDEITSLKIFYNQPQQRRELTYKMIKEVMEKLRSDKPSLAPERIWKAYELLDETKSKSPANELIALVSIMRKVTGIDKQLTPYDKTVNKNYKDWIFRQNSSEKEKFNPEQKEWLKMIRDHIASSFHIENEDFENTPFDGKGGLGKMYQLFGKDTEKVIEEMNEVLGA